MLEKNLGKFFDRILEIDHRVKISPPGKGIYSLPHPPAPEKGGIPPLPVHLGGRGYPFPSGAISFAGRE